MFGFNRHQATTKTLVLNLSELDKTARTESGTKAAYLGELMRAGATVPAGFVVTADAFQAATQGPLGRAIRQELAGLSVIDDRQLQARGLALEQLIGKLALPRSIETAVRTHYQRLSDNGGNPLVAVRSSIIVPGEPDGRATAHSATVLNVAGADAVLAALRHVWSATFAPAALTDWLGRGVDPAQVGVAVVVQRMVPADVAGVLFTVDPATNDRTVIVIEAVRGLGQALTGGLITPDRYTVDRETLTIGERNLAPQTWQLGRTETDATGLGGTRHVPVPLDQQSVQKLSNEQIVELAQTGRSLADHFGNQLDIEWVIASGQRFIVDARPVPSVIRPVPVTAENGGQKTEDRDPSTDVQEAPSSDLRPPSHWLGERVRRWAWQPVLPGSSTHPLTLTVSNAVM